MGDRGRVPRSGDEGDVVEIGLVERIVWDVGEDLDDDFEREVADGTIGICRGDGVMVGVLRVQRTWCCFCLCCGGVPGLGVCSVLLDHDSSLCFGVKPLVQ